VGDPATEGGGRRASGAAKALLAAFLAVAALSAIRPADWFNWISETFPAWIGAAVLVATHRRFPFTTLTYALVFVFACILFAGGHYTYAAVPMGEWMKGWFGFERNHFDRLGHFFQGVIPAMLAREMLLRRTPLRPCPAVFFLCSAAALAVSALYEIFEWRYAVTFGGEAATDFLGSQGDPWDAQQDMTMALVGAMASQFVLARWQDRQIAALAPPAGLSPAGGTMTP
jgi:putative membrane protein